MLRMCNSNPAWIVQMLDSAINQINHYPVDIFTFDGQLCLLTFAIVYRLTQDAKLVHSQFSHSSLRAIRQMFLVDNGSSPFQKKSNRQRISSPLGILLAIFFNLSAI